MVVTKLKAGFSWTISLADSISIGQKSRRFQKVMAESNCCRLVDKVERIGKKSRSPYPSTAARITAATAEKCNGPVATSTKQSMSYVTVKGIESETSYLMRDWPIFILKELSDNAYDFLNDHYPNRPKNARVIAIHVKIDLSGDNDVAMLRIKIRNSNVDNIAVFKYLDEILDFGLWCSTKRDQHRETCGSLGDGLKRGLGMGYAEWTDGIDDKDSFTDKQWHEPLIVRHNGQEYRTLIRVDKSNQIIQSELQGPYELTIAGLGNDTEIEVTLPIPTYDMYVVLARLEEYYKIYKLAKSNTCFSFNVEEI
jgi:hypothetical protein